MIITLEDSFTVGQDTFFESISPTSSFGVTFEDDLTTGYFYAVETKPDLLILDALHIYNVENVIDKGKKCNIKVAWSADSYIAMLFINNYCHAIFDFKNKAGYCRTGFPSCNEEWCKTRNRMLTDEFFNEIFRANQK